MLIFSLVLKNFPSFYAIRKFITVFTGTHHWYLSWETSIQPILPPPISLRSMPKLLSIWLSHQNPVWIHLLPKHAESPFQFHLLYSIFLIASDWETSYEVLPWEMLSSLPLPHPSSAQIFSSAPSLFSNNFRITPTQKYTQNYNFV
jgi:hypothetical protein